MSALLWRLGVEAVSGAVDGDVVVIPAQSGQVGWVVRTALRSGDHMVGLEPVPGSATVDDTVAVTE